MKRSRIIVGAFATTASLVAGLSISAAAVNYTGDCASGRMCAYNDAGFQNVLSRHTAPFARSNLTLDQSFKMSSWENHSSYKGAWFDGNALHCFVMTPYTVNTDVGALWNDTMVSWQGDGGC